jgi:hypothetical protein
MNRKNRAHGIGALILTLALFAALYELLRIDEASFRGTRARSCDGVPSQRPAGAQCERSCNGKPTTKARATRNTLLVKEITMQAWVMNGMAAFGGCMWVRSIDDVRYLVKATELDTGSPGCTFQVKVDGKLISYTVQLMANDGLLVQKLEQGGARVGAPPMDEDAFAAAVADGRVFHRCRVAHPRQVRAEQSIGS